MFLFSSDPLLKHVTITNNTSFSDGAGMYLDDSNPILNHMTISHNNIHHSNTGGPTVCTCPRISSPQSVCTSPATCAQWPASIDYSWQHCQNGYDCIRYANTKCVHARAILGQASKSASVGTNMVIVTIEMALETML